MRNLATTSFVWAVLSIGLSGSLCAGEAFVDRERGYELQLPDGFHSYEGDAKFGPDVERAFVLKAVSDDQGDLLIVVQRMGGTISPESRSVDQLSAQLGYQIFKEKWKTYDLYVIRVPETSDGLELLTFNVQIPLVREAIQLSLIGTADREEELRSHLKEVLAGLDGESNWSRPESEGRRLRMLSSPWISEDSFPTIFIACLIAFGVVGLVVFYLLSRFGPPASVLIAGLCLFAASWAIPENDYRELRGLEGGMRMLGDAGILLGIADLVFKRWRKPRAAPSSVEPESQSNDAVP